MTEGRSSNVTIAVIGLVGVIAAAVIGNWDRIFGRDSGPSSDPGAQVTPSSERSAVVPETPRVVPPSTLDDARREAERIATQWFDARRVADVDTLVRLSKPPFYFDNQILLSTGDLRARYQQFQPFPGEVLLKVDRMQSGTIREFKRLGYVTAHDRVIYGLQLGDDDIAVAITVSFLPMKGHGDGSRREGETTGFFFRRVGSALEMAGFWD